MTQKNRIGQAIADLIFSPRLPLFLGLLSMALASPSLFIGFELDDYLHRYCGLELPGSREICPSYLSLFTIIPGVPKLTHQLMEDGFAPWWTNENLRVAFLRPVSSFTHRLDYLLFPDSPLLMHLHNMLWLGAAVYVATLLYRRFMGVSAMSFATAVAFAVDHVHAMPVSWIANRNALIGAFFGTAAILVYAKSREQRSVRLAGLGVACLLVGLLGGEIALGAWAYLLAYALVLDEAPLGERLRALLPYLLGTVAWRLAYDFMGFGAAGSGLYIDPLAEPLVFLRVLPERIPLLLLGTFGIPPAEAVFFVGAKLATLAVVASISFTALIAVSGWAIARYDRDARFWMLGTLFALVPACTAIPHNRLLYFPSLGAMGVLAHLINALRIGDPRLPRGAWDKANRVFVFLSGGLHAAVSPLLLPVLTLNIWVTRSITDEVVPSAYDALTDPPSQELVLVNAPEYYSGTFPRLMARLEHRPDIGRQRLLSVGPVPIDARRLDAHRLELTYEGGLLGPMLTRLYRGRNDPFTPGDRVTLEGLTIEVTRVTDDGRPLVAVFTFEKPLDSAALCWVVWQKDHFVRFSPPSAGEVVHIAEARSTFEIG
ncbi:MAG TPA: hypothetical protein VHC69_16600 [Polyangiaceae bacterium]|nr:hypothetical protein [Polyangiaceae bacterium]